MLRFVHPSPANGSSWRGMALGWVLRARQGAQVGGPQRRHLIIMHIHSWHFSWSFCTCGKRHVAYKLCKERGNKQRSKVSTREGQVMRR